jgi:predicted O-methyltransferase YrrM
MEITDPRISKYIEEHSSEPNNLLQKIERDTYLRSVYPRMLSGKTQGRFISMVSRMIRPKYVLEIGTFTGYSAICLAEGLQKNGQLHTIEINEELGVHNDGYFKEAGLQDKIITWFGNALDIIPQLGIEFDLIFIDADKINYCKYFELSMEVLKTGGFILADNVLWSGKVLNRDAHKTDKDTEAVMAFNELVQRDARVENVIVPLRDGMTLIQKIC